jgi:hypothetical protein
MLDCQSTKAFVLDDSIKIRHGKKMPGVSSHFDHTLGRSVMGQAFVDWQSSIWLIVFTAV